MTNIRRVLTVIVLLAASAPGAARAQAVNARVLVDEVDDEGHGVTVVHVWGTHEEMGYALGVTLADDLVDAMEQVHDFLGTSYDMARMAARSLTWPEPELEIEMDAFVNGVLAEHPDADIDGADLRIVNALSDLPYTMCRSHSAWGRYVASPVRTLTTRRFDYSAVIDFMHHHLLVAMDPDDGEQWVNVGWGGVLAVITGVNEHGTVSALHDLGRADIMISSPVPRSAAARAILTGVAGMPAEDHAAWAEALMGDLHVMTDTFITYYVPEGLGGMFTCENQVCSLLRPQDDFLFGEAIITTNSTTDGHSVPQGGEWLEDYYDEGGPKDLESHWEVSHPSFHRLSVEFRGQRDMTLWFDGEIPDGLTDRVELEWSELFQRLAADGDADADSDADGDGDGDAGGDGDADGDGDGAADGDTGGDDGGCSISRRAASVGAALQALIGF